MTSAPQVAPSSYESCLSRFEKSASEFPEKLAVVSSRAKLTYRELDSAANKVSCALRALNVRREEPVMMLFERSIFYYAANIGVMKAGAAFLPVSPENPDERLLFMMKDSAVRLVFTDRKTKKAKSSFFNKLCKQDSAQKNMKVLVLEDVLSSTVESQSESVFLPPERLAYVIYTSGSTGRPKGVLIEHGSFANFIFPHPENIESRSMVENADTFLAIADFSFDFAILEEFIPLSTEKTVVLADEEEILNPPRLARLALSHHVDCLSGTPSYLSALLSFSECREFLKKIKIFNIGAEPFTVALYKKLRAVNPSAIIVNAYGPTEAAMSCTAKILTDADDISIGTPTANTELFVIDENGNEVPKGEKGELLICGLCVGRGYQNPNEKMAAAFTTFRGLKAYHSGDLARVNEAGELELFGRIDNQVKVHNRRVELEEVESVVSECPDVQECAAAVSESCRLLLFYTAMAEKKAKETKETIVQKWAKNHLIPYMVPDRFICVKEIPHNVNWKIDRKKLLTLVPQENAQTSGSAVAGTDTERRVLSIV